VNLEKANAQLMKIVADLAARLPAPAPAPLPAGWLQIGTTVYCTHEFPAYQYVPPGGSIACTKCGYRMTVGGITWGTTITNNPAIYDTGCVGCAPGVQTLSVITSGSNH
jgi:hypothetical protein